MSRQGIVCFEQLFKKPIDSCQQEEDLKQIPVKLLKDKIQQLRRDIETHTERETAVRQFHWTENLVLGHRWKTCEPRIAASLNDRLKRSSGEVNKSSMMNPKTKRYNLSDSTIRLVEEEDQFDFLCEGFDSPRARMSCGHVVTSMSLTKWCQQLLKQGESRFVCGQSGCNAEWSYQEVCKMALLTPEEMKNFAKTMALNAATKNPNTKFCPGCMTPVTRGSSSNLYVCCHVCSAKTGRSFGFCWQCLREWKGQQPRSDRCENDDCHNSALKTLRECPEVQINTVEGVKEFPSVRACPTCGSLIQHTGTGCKNMKCPRCKMSFCFGCLKTGDCYGVCPSGIADRQTSIPVWDGRLFHTGRDDYFCVEWE